ncbi:MAG: choice-of-anchor Q domain-containing protein [Pyrinomonadaceae bacterium]
MKSLVPVLLVFLLCVFLVFAAAGGARGAVVTVTKVADTNDGVCDADCSLREAVIAAASGDTVVFSSLFNSPQTITLVLGQITIDKNLTITGTGKNLVTISGNLAGRIFFISGNLNVTMSGMKLRDGRVGATFEDAFGGAIRVFNGNGNLDLSNMEFTNNLAFYEPDNFGLGSAIYCFGCTMTLANLNVHDHQRGAIYGFDGMGTVNVRDSVFSNNRIAVTAYTLNMQNTTVTNNTAAGISSGRLTLINSTITNAGQGVIGGDASATMAVERSIISGNPDIGLVGNGSAIIRNTVVRNNQYIGSGAGISNLGTMYVIDCAIFGNTAAVHGGGIASYGHLILTNSTVSGNIANGAFSTAGLGGGIYANGPLTITNSTISNNQSKGGGGGIRKDSGGAAFVRNSIIAGNTSTSTNEEDVSGIFASQGTNIIGNTFGSSGWIAGDLLNMNPMLGPLVDNGGGTMTHALLPGSPAIDAGNNSLAVDPQTQMFLIDDQRGFPRRVGVLVDIGAYESTQTASAVIAGSVTYGLGSPRFVPGVLVGGVGSPNVSATTLGAGPGQGTYLLAGFGSSSYTVTPTKIGDVGNGISSFDSGRIAQYVAGIITLTGNQFIVADVSGNGTLSSFDAGQIARYVAGLDNSGSTGNWIFVPVNRSYSSLTSNITGEDFIALLMGDVSGNWSNGSGQNVEGSALTNMRASGQKGDISGKWTSIIGGATHVDLGTAVKREIFPNIATQRRGAVRGKVGVPADVLRSMAMAMPFDQRRSIVSANISENRPVPVQQAPKRPVRFDVNCLAVDNRGQERSRPVIWAATGKPRNGSKIPRGTLFKSIDGGRSWDRIEHSYMHRWSVQTLAITHFEGNTILLAGLGHTSYSDMFNHGIMRSDDGGARWYRVYDALRATSIAVDSEDPRRVTAAVTVFAPLDGPPVDRTIRSSDAGATWETIDETGSDGRMTTEVAVNRPCRGVWHLRAGSDGLLHAI